MYVMKSSHGEVDRRVQMRTTSIQSLRLFTSFVNKATKIDMSLLVTIVSHKTLLYIKQREAS